MGILFRILGLLFVAGVLFFLFKQIYDNVNLGINSCEYCDGKGHWLGTRGEKNRCKVCNGSGKRN